MPTEIERKFLVQNKDWQQSVIKQEHYIQGYLSNNNKNSIRIRICNDKAFLNIKSATLGIHRQEYDYEIPFIEAKEMLHSICEQPVINKTRYFVPYENHTWEIDVFADDNAGLVVAEIELSSVEESFTKPSWLGQEVTDDPRYYNVCLIDNPYCNW